MSISAKDILNILNLYANFAFSFYTTDWYLKMRRFVENFLVFNVSKNKDIKIRNAR